MAALTSQQITQLGLVPALAAASVGGDSFSPGDESFLMVKNASGSSINVTVATTATAFGEPIANIVTPVAAGVTALIGPFPVGEVGQPGSGQANVTYSAVTTVTVAAITL